MAFARMSEKQDLEVTILMPCLDEAEALAGCVEEALRALRASGCEGEVLVADNGSTDGSQEIARKAGARVVLVVARGYGNALIGGIRAARGRYVLMGDADGSYDFGELPRFLESLRQGADIVMGCRFPSGGGTIMPGAMPWKHRWIGNPVLSWLGRVFFKVPVQDFQCGLRAVRRDAALPLGLTCPGMEFASEMVVKAVVARLKFAQVPITLRPDRRKRPPHIRSWRDGWRHLRFLLVYSPKWLFFLPGMLLALLGLVGFLLLLPGPVTVGQVTFDTNTLLVCAMSLLVGLQALFFAVHSKAYACSIGLLPPDPRIERLLTLPYVEIATVAGLLLMLLGGGALLAATMQWEKAGFGSLSHASSLRVVIPAVTGIALGAQVMFSAFALAVIGLLRGGGMTRDPGGS
jgi:glycosyltransferase involved in cell wall biosynthesis